jgi:hypothetical protein
MSNGGFCPQKEPVKIEELGNLAFFSYNRYFLFLEAESKRINANNSFKRC